MSARISVDFVSHTFKGQPAPTLKEVDLNIAPGEQVALIGRSGCGKSTLLHILAGLLLPTEGCVRINGTQVSQPSAKWNMMFQRPSLYPWMTVRKNAELGLVFARKKDRAKVDNLLRMVGLSDKADASVQDLSGGQQQRVALARSLATAPDVLLLDEPFSALDAFTRMSLQDEVAQIARREGLSLVLVTHDIDEAVAMADRVLIMAAGPGRLVEQMIVELPFPRDRSAAAFSERRRELMRLFEACAGNSVAPPGQNPEPALLANHPY